MGLNGCTNGALAYTKFLFVTPRRNDDAAGARLRAAGGSIARGFFNDFDVDGTREQQPTETIQFLIRNEEPAPVVHGEAVPGDGVAESRYAVQVSGRYRPRLVEVEEDLRRRLGDAAEVAAIDGAARAARYTSAEMHEYAERPAPARRSGRVARHAIIVPIRKTNAWWQMGPLDRQMHFYPHVDPESGRLVKGHAMLAAPGIPVISRRLFHNPDGYQREGQWDFVAYFECDDAALPVFAEVHGSLRDTVRNPEWRYVEEGPVWRGRRVLRW